MLTPSFPKEKIVNKLIKRLVAFCFSIFSFIVISPSVAATVPDGKIIVRVEDGSASRCINSTTDRITMNLRRIIVNKDIGFFTEDRAAAVIVNTTISGEEGGATQKKVNFPRMYVVNTASYLQGYTSLPIEEKLFSRFSLTNSGNSYDTAEVEFTVLAKKGKAPFGLALSALADISKSLPTPMNPFSEGFKYFSDYANKVIEGSLNENNNIGQQSKEGKITLSFSSTSTCTGDQEYTGTLAIVSGVKEKDTDGFVDIKKDYCWKAVFKPVFTLKFAPKPTNSTCAGVAEGLFKQVNNPYLAFYLNAEPKTLTSSSVAQVKTIALPTNNIKWNSTNSTEIERSISVAYYAQDISDSTSAHRNTVKKITNKVSGVLNDTNFFSKKPITTSSDQANVNVITWPTTVVDSVAIDLAESLNRCSTHGIDVADCL